MGYLDKFIDAKVKTNPRPYILQSLLATFTILLILMFLDVLTHTAFIAVLGSSAFVVFTRPRAYGSRPRRLIGGYLIGMLAGLICFYLAKLPQLVSLPVEASTIFIIFSALSVGSAIFLMVVTNMEHGPAAGMALGMVVNPWNLFDLAFILSAVLFMAVTRRLLRRYMIDLI
jgi:CBS-domain-containing membrane protein